MNQVDARLLPELVERFGALRRAAGNALDALEANSNASLDQAAFVKAQRNAVEILQEIVAMQDGEVRDEEMSASHPDES